MHLERSNVVRGALAVVLAASGLVAAPGLAHAKVQRVVPYAFDQVWPAAIRFLRVDAHFEIVERDAEAGYILFDVSEERKRFRGALELVRVEDDQGRSAIRLVIHIEDRPSYMELGVLERLERKLREDLGEPREPPPKAKESPKSNKQDKARREDS